VPQEVFHLERLLLRVREWAVEVRPVNHEIMAFAERMQTKTADVKSVAQFADHRLDMIRKFTQENWLESAMNYVQKEIEVKKEKEKSKEEDTKLAKLDLLKRMKEMEENRMKRSDKTTGKRNFQRSAAREDHNSVSNEMTDRMNEMKKRQQEIRAKKQKQQEEQLAKNRRLEMMVKRKAAKEAKETANTVQENQSVAQTVHEDKRREELLAKRKAAKKAAQNLSHPPEEGDEEM